MKRAVELEVTQTLEEGQQGWRRAVEGRAASHFPHCLPWLSSQVGNT